MLNSWWHKQNVRWSKGGGYVAARLWWLFFAIIAGVLLTSPLFYRWREPQLGMKRTSNLKQIGTALVTYVQDYDEQLPPMEDVASLRHALTNYLPKYASEDVWEPRQLNVAYAVNKSLSYRPFQEYPHADTVVAVWDTRVQGGGHTVLFLDSHVKFIPLRQWDALRLASGITQDVTAPPLSWWSSRTPEDFRWYTAGSMLLVAVTVAFAAAWREACVWKWGGDSRTSFIGWLLLRFLGYGFCVFLAALLVSCLIGVPFVIPLTQLRYR